MGWEEQWLILSSRRFGSFRARQRWIFLFGVRCMVHSRVGLRFPTDIWKSLLNVLLARLIQKIQCMCYFSTTKQERFGEGWVWTKLSWEPVKLIVLVRRFWSSYFLCMTRICPLWRFRMLERWSPLLPSTFGGKDIKWSMRKQSRAPLKFLWGSTRLQQNLLLLPPQ